MDLNNVVNRHFQDTKGLFNQNSRFIDSGAHLHRNKVLILELHKSDHPDKSNQFNGDNFTFSVKLHNPLHIETISDIYLDNIYTYDTKSQQSDDSVYLLYIEEFDISSYSNVSEYSDKIIISNETSGTENHVVHKSRKMNYVSTILPKTIHSLTGSITTGSVATSLQLTADDSHVRMEFIIVPRN